MKIYRVHLYTQKEGLEGYEFFPSMEAAQKRASEYKKEKRRFETPEPRIEALSIGNPDPNKTSIIQFLNKYASHPRRA